MSRIFLHPAIVVQQLYRIKLDGALESQLNITGSETVSECSESFLSGSFSEKLLNHEEKSNARRRSNLSFKHWRTKKIDENKI